MTNFLGKFLVLVHTGLAFVGLFWAVGMYMSVIDWGWKEPRRGLDLRDENERKKNVAVPRIASEIDKRVAAIGAAAKGRDLVLPTVKRNQDAWRRLAEQHPVNHMFYVTELKRLNSDTKPIEVKGVQYKGGDPVLDPPLIGSPLLADPVPGIKKSYTSYEAELIQINKDIEKVTSDSLKWITDAQKITFNLTGKDDKGTKLKAGLYELHDQEFAAQQAAKFEKEYLQPRWARALEEADSFRDRKEILEETLTRLQNRKK